MVQLADSISGYFKAISQAFDSLDAVAKSEAEQVKRKNLMHQVLAAHTKRLRHSFECWEHQCRFLDSFKIDTDDSGFPLYHHVLDLNEKADRRREYLLDMPKPEEIREQMIDQLLKYKQFPKILVGFY